MKSDTKHNPNTRARPGPGLGLGLGLVWARTRFGLGLGPGPTWARARLGPRLGLGPGPAWAQAQLELELGWGSGHLGPRPSWARAQLDPGPAWVWVQLGPGSGLGPGPAWVQARLGPGPSPSATCLAQGFIYGFLVFASPEPVQSGSHLFFLGGSCRVRPALRKAGRAFPQAGLHTPSMAWARACDLPCARTFVCFPCLCLA